MKLGCLPCFADLSQAIRERMAYIDMRLMFLGDVRRQDLVDRFGIQSAAATRDLALYRTLTSVSIVYDAVAKTYIRAETFKPSFNFNSERILSLLSQGFGDGESVNLKSWVPSETPARLALPDLDILSSVTRAIHLHCPLRVEYHSVSSGKSKRELIPFALIDNGLRWHVRCFDRQSLEFRDFVLTRIKHPFVMKGQEVGDHERSECDVQWTRIVEIDLIPHPDQPHSEITSMDYAMKNGILKLKLRAATAGYTLRKWNVDCSTDHHLRGPEFRLWLKDNLTLYGVKSAYIAPGYTI